MSDNDHPRLRRVKGRPLAGSPPVQVKRVMREVESIGSRVAREYDERGMKRKKGGK